MKALLSSLSAPFVALVAFAALFVVGACAPRDALAAGQLEPITTCAPGRDCIARSFMSQARPLASFPACITARAGQLAFDGDAGAYRFCSFDGGWALLDTAGGSTGTEGPDLDPLYAAAGDVWKPYVTIDGFIKPPAKCWQDAARYTVCAGAVQRTALVGPLAGEIMFRLPLGSMNPRNAGEREFKCASWSGEVSVHVTGNDFDAGSTSGYSGAGWVRIYDWAGQPEKAISIDCVRFRP